MCGMTANNDDLHLFVRAATHMADSKNEIMVIVELEQGLERYDIYPLTYYASIPELRKPKLIRPFFPRQASEFSPVNPNGSIDNENYI